MKNLGRLFLIAIFVVPIVVCILVLRSIWSSPKENSSKESTIKASSKGISVSDPVYVNDDESGNGSGNSSATYQMGSETYTTNIGPAISKLYTDAEISSVLSNVYLDANEKSEVVGKLEKRTTVVAQKFPEGWTRVAGKDNTGASISGWVKTSNVSFPSDNGDLNTSVEPAKSNSKGKVTADGLNLRLNPSTSATVLTVIPNGTELEILESNNGWYKVTYNKATGWVSAQYVK